MIRCKQCGKEIDGIKKRKFCSRECYHKWHNHQSYLKNKEKVFARVRERRKTKEYKQFMKLKRQTSEYKEKMRFYQMKWANTPEGRKSLRESKRRYDKTEKGKENIKRWLNSDKWKEYKKEYYLNPKNKKRLKDWRKRWEDSEEGKKILKNADKKYRKSQKGFVSNQIKCSKRRTRKKQLIHNFTKEEWMNKLNLTNGFCLNCKHQVGITNLTLDHIVPISSGIKKEYFIEDVQPLCKSCNSSKRDKIL